MSSHDQHLDCSSPHHMHAHATIASGHAWSAITVNQQLTSCRLTTIYSWLVHANYISIPYDEWENG